MSSSHDGDRPEGNPRPGGPNSPAGPRPGRYPALSDHALDRLADIFGPGVRRELAAEAAAPLARAA